MTECILDEPINSAWPVASDWLETFLHDGGNRWDHRIASVMTADAVTAALAHTTRPVRLVGAAVSGVSEQPRERILDDRGQGRPLLGLSGAVGLQADLRGCARGGADQADRSV